MTSGPTFIQHQLRGSGVGGGALEFLNWAKYLFHFLSAIGAYFFFTYCLKLNIFFHFFLNSFSVNKFGSQTRLSIARGVEDFFLRYANGVHLNAIWENTALAQ